MPDRATIAESDFGGVMAPRWAMLFRLMSQSTAGYQPSKRRSWVGRFSSHMGRRCQ